MLTHSTLNAPTQLTPEQDSYLALIRSTQLKAIGTVNREIIVAINNDGDVKFIEDFILKDASLTAHILKTASSAVYAASKKREKTSIRYAIVRIGFEGIRSICITVALIGNIPERHSINKQNLVKCISRSFHNALQSKNVAIKMGGCQEQETYIAGLLQNIGELAFWCSPLHNMAGYTSLVETGLEPEECCYKLCGQRFRDLSITLGNEWNLGEVLVESLCDAPVSNNGKAVKLGTDIVSALELGWESVEMKAIDELLRQEFGMDHSENKEFIFRGFTEAINEVVGYFPEGEAVLRGSVPSDILAVAPEKSSKKALVREKRAPDEQVQLQAIKKMKALGKRKSDQLNYFKILTQTMVKGVALERVVVAVPDSRGENIKAISLAGRKVKEWASDFSFSIDKKGSFLNDCLQSSRAVLVSRDNTPKLYKSAERSLGKTISGTASFLICPVIKSGTPIALVYADMAEENWLIDDNQFEQFSILVQQLSILLTSSKV
ncbi:MAG: HD-like signal output (HDOD) protein [Gammaproteobacteria bacterium]|jgi:HD-like signal output (HDOD) protein